MKKKILTLAAVAVLGIASVGAIGCGSNHHGVDESLDGNCAYNGFTSVQDGFMNGDEITGTPHSYWNCDEAGVFDAFSIYAEGSGITYDTSSITTGTQFGWDQTGCQSFDYDSDNGESGTVSNITPTLVDVTNSDGTITTNVIGLDFDHTVGSSTVAVSCYLVNFN